MTDDLSTSLAAVLAGLCDNCWRPVASEADWAAHESGDYEGDGSDKCWDHVCYGSDLKVADVLAPFVESLLNAAKRDAWNEGFTRGFYDVLAGGDRDACESAAANPYDRSEPDA